ncbi:MAG TPA: Asp23/Gls24 family envelope stress response protein [Streptosporangiaceae bacterium]|nr:Asp23/Gls24 family envelope stress response protein [Streptosporangiaceae bacterium]
MSDFDNASYSANGDGGDSTRAEVRSMPFFPAPPGGPQPVMPLAAPTLAAPAPAPAAANPGRHMQPEQNPVAEPPALEAPRKPEPTAVVKGRIKIEDRVVEKVAALAALEVTGVAALAGEVPGAEAPGVKASVRDTEVSVDVTVVVDYGSVVMDVAKTVKNNVARVVGVMLGLKVTEVNVTVDDVRMPGAQA